ncbi:nuclear transport factor 2 family protein [Dyadobacter sp. LHD-138]|uniref:nuclear transport factor 2 family protein n=1 Tax=Dyadobacter sp. LHD-138 TaxID=3071413 RepID=UPI0027DF05E2|nr:nuclear transport factor 2 family protein [Dyadobacter sp. LHD-138]MDQ6479332.1 nuclear transport factor 2 family protein [Dyadobacter sp. LHD-138]
MTQLEHVQQVEGRLLKAMLNDDLSELDKLLADDLLVTAPDGLLVGKAADMEAHRNGEIRIDSMKAPETDYRFLPDVTIVFVLMEITGRFQGQKFEGRYRYTRVWQNRNGNWQIVAAHISLGQ